MFLDLFRILVHPRQTMRRVLDSGGEKWVVPLVLLAFITRSISDPDVKDAGKVFRDMPTAALVACIIVVSACVALVLFFVFGWVATFIGRHLGGHGTVREVRTALAWGLAPLLFTPLYRIPAALVVHGMNVTEKADRTAIFEAVSRGGCTYALLFVLLDLAFSIWYIVIASATLGEAHRFSSWRGFGVFAISAIIPIVIAAAAALTLSM